MNSLPESVQDYVSQIAKSGCAERIILFGSRARGDFRENSDFDLAVKWYNHKSKEVLELQLALAEQPITLYKIDLIDIDEVSSAYLQEIKNEGVILWQKKD